MGRERIRDGYVGLIDSRGARIVADNFFGTNEVRLDPAEEWLYVVETAGNHISRLRVGADGALTDREVYGPDDLGGRPDGMTFDAYGNLWITLVSHDRLIALTPEGDVLTIWEDGDPEAKAQRDRAERRVTATPELIQAARGRLAPRMASVTFGGEDLSTVYIGSLLGTTLPTSFARPCYPASRWSTGRRAPPDVPQLGPPDVSLTVGVRALVVLPQQVLAVVVAVGRAHHRVDVDARRRVVVEDDPALVIELDQHHRTVDAVIKDAVVGGLAVPQEERLVEVGADFLHLDTVVPRPQPTGVDLHESQQRRLLLLVQLGKANALVRQLDVVALSATLDVAFVRAKPTGRQIDQILCPKQDGLGLLIGRQRAHELQPLLLFELEHARPACLPDSAYTGSDPRNAGVNTTWSPSTRKFRLQWCPSSCQPHGASVDGVPKMVSQYTHSPYSSQLSVNSPMVSFRRITLRVVS